MASPGITLQQIKHLVIIALASDDMLMETLVLKGGNAIDLLPGKKGKIVSRASYDIDFSMAEDFDDKLENIFSRIKRTIETTFAERELIAFDFNFAQRPKVISDEVRDFWGGYYIDFKLITVADFRKYDGDIINIRKNSIPVKPDLSPRVDIEISKYEYVGEKIETRVDGHTIYMYSPQMIVFEKIRAICQQNPEYVKIIPSHVPRPRARDFYDIFLVADQHKVSLASSESQNLLQHIFDAKKVPLSFLSEIKDHSDIHRGDWTSVIDTLPADERRSIEPFELYLGFVLSLVEPVTSS